jgi:hypothetical protein
MSTSPRELFPDRSARGRPSGSEGAAIRRVRDRTVAFPSAKALSDTMPKPVTSCTPLTKRGNITQTSGGRPCTPDSLPPCVNPLTPEPSAGADPSAPEAEREARPVYPPVHLKQKEPSGVAPATPQPRNGQVRPRRTSTKGAERASPTGAPRCCLLLCAGVMWRENQDRQNVTWRAWRIEESCAKRFSRG